MKRLIPILLIVILTHCGQKQDLHMAGSYYMKSQVRNEGGKDSVINRQQMKIYTDDHVIYAAMRMPDSLASYGIGSYDIQDGKVVEHFFFSSANGQRNDTILLKIEKSDSGYTQVFELPTETRKYTQTEVYDLVGKSDSTPLDGAWKQTKNIFIRSGGDTTISPVITEYKVYQKGNFICAASIQDTATKRLRTFFGFGSFEMDGPNRSKELNKLSTFPPLIDSTVNIELEFMGNDAYKQTIVYPSNNKSVEFYTRMKKN